MTYWIIHIALICAFAFLGLKLIPRTISPKIYWTGLILKLFAGIVVGLIFFKYYGYGDTISFFNLAKEGGTSDEPRTRFFIQILTPLVNISGGNYWISSLWFSLVSFLCCWYLVNTISSLFPKAKYPAIFSFLFIPSVLFWSSGILKDSLAFSAIALVVSTVLRFYGNKKINLFEVVLTLIGLFILFKIKHYLFIAVILFGGLLASAMILKKMRTKWKWPITGIVLFLIFMVSQNTHPYLRVDRLAWTIYQNNQTILVKTKSQNQVDLKLENDDWINLLSKAPRALHIGLFRPSVFDNVPRMGLIHQIENLFLTLFVVLSSILATKEFRYIDWYLILISTISLLLLIIILPLSTPNFGTLVRYKNAYLPFLFLLSSVLPYRYFTSTRIK